MVQSQEAIGPIVLDDRVTPTRLEDMDPEERRKYEEFIDSVVDSWRRKYGKSRKRKKETA